MCELGRGKSNFSFFNVGENTVYTSSATLVHSRLESPVQADYFFNQFLLLISIEKNSFRSGNRRDLVLPNKKLPKIAFLTCFYPKKYFFQFENFRKCLNTTILFYRKALKFVSLSFFKNFDFGLVYTLHI